MSYSQAPEYGEPVSVSSFYDGSSDVASGLKTAWMMFAGDYYRVTRITPHFNVYMVAFKGDKGSEECVFLAADDVLYVTQHVLVLMALPMTVTRGLADWLRALLHWVGFGDRREG